MLDTKESASNPTQTLVGRAGQGVWNSGPDPELLHGRDRAWSQAPLSVALLFLRAIPKGLGMLLRAAALQLF